jgi:uncharacterized membrane protein YadS
MSSTRTQWRRAVGARELAIAAAALATCALQLPGFAALVLGALCAWTFGAPRASARIGGWLLKASVVALGAGIELARVWQVGRAGLATAALTLAVALAGGYALGRLLRIERDVAWLITAGTAICGGSAIAAAAPVLRARPTAVGIALGVVFVLNAVALCVFPPLGERLGLGPTAFGEWCALAIHDTSSVVAAAAQRGPDALEIATVTKLARSLWIVPLCAVLALAPASAVASTSSEDADAASAAAAPRWQRRRLRPPLFVLAFVGAAALVALVPALQPAGELVAAGGRRGLVLALFALGLSIDGALLRALRWHHALLGAVLWALLGLVSLALVR